MEAHLRKITRCLGKAVEQLEKVSTSEKTAGEVDAEWIARFHAGITVPIPPDSCSKTEECNDATATRNGKRGEEADLRCRFRLEGWKILESTWLPLLRDLHRTVSALDREEKEIQETEKASESKETGASGLGNAAEHATSNNGVSGRRGQAPPRPPKGLLSLRDYTVIHSTLELVVHWGLVPVLEPGVGVFDFDKRPRSRAVKISRRVLHFWRKQEISPNSGGASPLDPTASKLASPASTDGIDRHHGAGGKRVQLAQCMEVIQRVVTTEQFLPMLLPLYLPDLLAARLQLAYGRDAAATAACDSSTPTAAIPPKGSSVGMRGDRNATAKVTGGFRTVRKPPEGLKRMLSDYGPRHIMTALRQLLSEGARTPPWLRHHGGRILSEIVLRPGGVQATLEVYLAGAWAARGGADSSGSGGWEGGDGLKACLRVAKLLATPPKWVRCPGVYVTRVAPQLAEMLHYNGQQRAVISRVVVMIVGRLSESMPRETRRLVLHPLLRPMLLFWGPECERCPPISNERSTTDATPIASTESPIARTPAGSLPTRETAVAIADEATKVVKSAVRGDGVVASEEALGRCLDDLEKILTAAPAPPTLLSLLSHMGITVPLFRMHCFCKRAKSRNLQGTKACLAAIFASYESAATDLIAAILPTKTRWGNSGAVFAAGPTGSTVLRVNGGSNACDVAAFDGLDGKGTAEAKLRDGSGEKSEAELGSAPNGSSSGNLAHAPRSDESLLGLEAMLEELGLGPETETLKLVGSASRLGLGDESPREGLMDILTELKEAEERAKDAAEMLEGLGKDSPVPGKVFDLLLRRYLAIKEGTSVSKTKENGVGNATDARISKIPQSTAAADDGAGKEHAVMVAVVVLAERLGARVFGTGAQVLSCIRLVLEHELCRGVEKDTDGGGGSRRPGIASERYADGRLRVCQKEAALCDEFLSPSGGNSVDPEVEVDGEEGVGDTLCSVVLGLLTTLLELGEETRAPEEEEELRAMLGPLKALAAEHHNAEVAEMSAMLCASILSRGLTPEQRREERERVRGACSGGGGDEVEGAKLRTARMLSALDAAEVDLRSDAVPMRARGIVTLTRLLRTSLESGKNRSAGKGGGIARVDMDTAVLERLMNTYARMTADTDSYVYLAAVQGLASLADALPGWCVPRLVGLFVASASDDADGMPTPDMTSDGTRSCAPARLSLSQRLKIGEAVVLSARRCGEVMPKYAHFFVNAFVVAARERSHERKGEGNYASPGPVMRETLSVASNHTSDDVERHSGPATNSNRGRQEKEFHERNGCESGGKTIDGGGQEGSTEVSLESKERYHFRASCLSNLAEVCQLLRWSLGRFSHDIVDLAVGVLLMETSGSEEAILARRGAAFLLSRLLRGAGSDVLEIVPMEQLRAAYRALKRTAERDRDETSRLHARSALSYLDVAIRGQLFPGSGSGGGDWVVDEARGRSIGGKSASSGRHPGITVL